MPELNQEDQQKLEQMVREWDELSRAIIFFVRVGKMLGWISGACGGIALMWHWLLHK